MPKYCRTYRTMCTCMTCLDKDCGYSEKTRLEAEAIHGVKLNRDGGEVKPAAADPPQTPDAAPPGAAASRPAVPRIKPALPQPSYDEAMRKRTPRVIPTEAIIIAAAALVLAIFVGGAVLAYVLVVVGPSADEPSQLAMAPEFPEGGVAAPAALEPAPTPVPLTPVAPTLTPPTAVPTAAAQTEQADASTATLKDLARNIATRNARMGMPAQRRVAIPPAELRQLDEIRDEGNKALEAGNYELAREQYRRAIEQNPNYFEGINNLANTFSDTGNMAEAEPIYLRGLAVEPQSSYLHFNLGLNHMRAGNYDQALRRLDMVLALNPDDKEATLLAGLCAYRVGNDRLAERLLSEYIRLDADSPYGYYGLALLYRRLGQHDVAEPYFAQARQLNPTLGQSR